MIEREYWIYQKQGATPWALYVVTSHAPRAKALADYETFITIYHEDIDNATHSVSALIKDVATFSDFLERVYGFIKKTLPEQPFDENDESQLIDSFLAIFAEKQ